MTQLELLAAKIRGADSNAEAAVIIADWYDGKVKHSRQNSQDSAKILRDDAGKFDKPYDEFLLRVASNFETSATLLEFDRNE